jgi:hypothetical protein
MLSHVDQNVVGLRLTVQARSRCAKGRMATCLSAVGKDVGDIARTAWQDDDLRYKSIWAGVGCVSHQINNALQDLAIAQDAHKIVPNACRRAVDH